MMVRLIVDLNSCIGSAECVALDPDAIELDNDGLAQPLLPEHPYWRQRRPIWPGSGVARSLGGRRVEADPRQDANLRSSRSVGRRGHRCMGLPLRRRSGYEVVCPQG